MMILLLSNSRLLSFLCGKILLHNVLGGTYNMRKLVRDKIPNIINDGSKFEVLSNDDYRLSLREKVVEEATEVKAASTRANLVEELGDLEEVIRAILDDASITYEEMDSLRHAKINQKGKFTEKFAMINIKEES